MLNNLLFFLLGVILTIIITTIIVFSLILHNRSKVRILLEIRKGGRYILKIYRNKNTYKCYMLSSERCVLSKLKVYNPNTAIKIIEANGLNSMSSVFDIVKRLQSVNESNMKKKKKSIPLKK